mgnify:CR=1 FL=1
MELVIEKISDELQKVNKSTMKLSEKLEKVTKESMRDTVPKFGTCQTFRDDKENIPINLADEVKGYSHRRQETNTIDKVDLLIMCDKIKSDFQKTLRESVGSHQYQTIQNKSESFPESQRDNKNELRNSIEKYKSAYGLSLIHI